MTPGAFVRALEELEAMDEPFPPVYPIVYLKLKKDSTRRGE